MNKNILFITPNSGVDGGSFRSGLKLCELLKKNYSINPIMLLREKGEGLKLVQNIGIQTKFLRYYSWVVSIEQKATIIDIIKMNVKQALNLFTEIYIYIMIKRYNIQLVHINSATINVGLKAAKMARIKCIWHVRELLDEDQHLVVYKDQWISDFKKADVIIAISECVRKKYVKLTNPMKVQKVYNGIAIEEFYARHSIFKEKNVKLLCVGSMLGYKGHDEIIEAINVLHRKNIKNVHITFVGDGRYRRQYEKQIVSYGLDNYFTFEGVKTNVSEYYKKADIVLMCSDFEAFGRVTIEAMLSGCLVIGSNTGATPELLQNNKYGYLYKKGSYEDLATVIINIIDNKENARITALKGQKYAQKFFTAQRNAEEISEIYNKLFVESST